MTSNAEISLNPQGCRTETTPPSFAVLDGRNAQISAFTGLPEEPKKTGPGTRCQCTPECEMILGPKAKHNARYWNRDHKKAAEKYRASISFTLRRLAYRTKVEADASRFLMDYPAALAIIHGFIKADMDHLKEIRLDPLKFRIPGRAYWEMFKRSEILAGKKIFVNDHWQKFVFLCLVNRYEDVKPFLKFKDQK